MKPGKYKRTPEINKKSSDTRKRLKLGHGKANGMYGHRLENAPNWQGGKRKDSCGYIQIFVGKEYPNNYKGYYLEHRYIIEQEIGRSLLTEEEVHHINGRRDDNRLENLMLFATASEHMKYHKEIIIVSNNLIKFIETDIRAIIRINLAWENTPEKIHRTLNSIFRPVFLDFPMNRTKYPLPSMNLEEAISIANEYDIIKYFAISNAESPEFIGDLKKKLNKRIKLVPKIESELGVEKLVEICKSGRTNICMLDREDLFKKINYDLKKITILIDLLYKKANKAKIKILELQGIVFSDPNEEENFNPKLK